VTVTVAELGAEVPPSPLHTRVNVLVALSAPVLALPDVALLPVHEPEAVQLVASVDDQVRVAD